MPARSVTILGTPGRRPRASMHMRPRTTSSSSSWADPGWLRRVLNQVVQVCFQGRKLDGRVSPLMLGHAVHFSTHLRHNECIQAAEDALDLYLDLKDPYAEAFELCCMAQWFMNYSRWQLAIEHAEDTARAMLHFRRSTPGVLVFQDALEILRAAPKPSASQELRALQILSQAHQGKGDKTGTDAVHESLKRFQQTDNRSAEAPAVSTLSGGAPRGLFA